MSKSTKLVAEWSGEITVGIYEDKPWSVRLYEDRAIVRMPYVKWTGQTGNLDFIRERITEGHRLSKLRDLAKSSATVDAFGDTIDAPERAFEIVDGRR